MSKYPNIDRLVDIIAQLRAENGCPWDREQTHDTLKRNILEETYELIDAINDNNKNAMKEELGDVLLQVVFHAQIAHENGEFDIDDVAKTISDKLIRRHPHVFGSTKVSGTDEVLKNWDEIKKNGIQKQNFSPRWSCSIAACTDERTANQQKGSKSRL